MKIFNEDDDAYVCYIPALVDMKSKRNISPGERGTLAYLRYMIYDSKFLERGDIVIIDAESALCTDIVQEYLFEHDISPFVLPCALHQFLNPCDNSFHSIFKQRYHRIISNMNDGNISVKEKFNLARQCFHEISEETVTKMFRRCGLLNSDQNKRSIVSNLMCEGFTSLNKNDQYHKKCLLSFLHWCRDNNLINDLCRIRFNVADLV